MSMFMLLVYIFIFQHSLRRRRCNLFTNPAFHTLSKGWDTSQGRDQIFSSFLVKCSQGNPGYIFPSVTSFNHFKIFRFTLFINFFIYIILIMALFFKVRKQDVSQCRRNDCECKM